MSGQSSVMFSTSPSSLQRGISIPSKPSSLRARSTCAPTQQVIGFDTKPARFLEEVQKLSISSSPRAPPFSASPLAQPFRVSPPSSSQNVVVGFEAATRTNSPVALPSVSTNFSRPGLLSQAFAPQSNVPALDQQIKELQDTIPPRFPDQNTWDVPLLPLQQAQEKHEVFSTDLVKIAYLIAARAHRGQTRKNGEPYLHHCLESASILADLGLGEHLVAAGLLHDVLHDTHMSKYELQEYMPTAVVELVEAVTRISKLSQTYRSSSESSQSEQLVSAITALGAQAVIVKLADRLHNMRTISVLSPEKQRGIAQETLEVYTVLANRLGLWCLKAELEDLSFKVLHPEEYAKLQIQVQERQNQGLLQGWVDSLKALLDSHNIQVEDISGRPKNLYGIYTKIVKNNLSLDQVYDIYAIRVIVRSKDDCYNVRRQVWSLWEPDVNRSKDYIRNKKENGYQSLHETVFGPEGMPFEVQIRTHKMHFMAEYGLSAHWQYKENRDCSQEHCDHMAALVKWQRWEATCKFGVHDKKIRPLGSPPKDMSLTSLGFEFVDSSLDKVDPLLKLERFRLKPVPSMNCIPVSVMLSGPRDAVGFSQLYQLPSGSTVRDLLGLYGLGSHDAGSHVITVNGQSVAQLSRVLDMGDEVDVKPLVPQALHPALGAGVHAYAIPSMSGDWLDCRN